MTRSQKVIVGEVFVIVAVAVFLVCLFWRQVVDVLALLVIGRLSWMVVRSHLGIKSRPKSSWSSLIRSGAIAFAAWNTRWFRPTQHKATISAKAGEEHRPDGWDR